MIRSCTLARIVLDQRPTFGGKGKGPGPLNQPVVVSPDGPGGAARPFVYNHVAKTGGSSAERGTARASSSSGSSGACRVLRPKTDQKNET